MNNCLPHKSSIFDLEANTMALITYVAAIIIIFIPGISFISWLLPIIVYFVESKSDYVKFHAMQAFLLNISGILLKFIIWLLVGGNVIALMFGPTNIFNWGTLAVVFILRMIISILIIICEVVCIIKAHNYEEYKLPIIGNITFKFMGRNE